MNGEEYISLAFETTGRGEGVLEIKEQIGRLPGNHKNFEDENTYEYMARDWAVITTA